MGPHAGKNGGEIISQGSPEETLHVSTLTAQYLKGSMALALPQKRRKGNDILSIFML